MCAWVGASVCVCVCVCVSGTPRLSLRYSKAAAFGVKWQKGGQQDTGQPSASKSSGSVRFLLLGAGYTWRRALERIAEGDAKACTSRPSTAVLESTSRDHGFFGRRRSLINGPVRALLFGGRRYIMHAALAAIVGEAFEN